MKVQSTLVISKSKGPSKTLWDIRTSTLQICSIEEKTIRTTKFHKWQYHLSPLDRNIYWKYCGKGEQFLLFSTTFCNLVLDFCVRTRTRFSLRDKRLFEITEVEITRVDCITVCISFFQEIDFFICICIKTPSGVVCFGFDKDQNHRRGSLYIYMYFLWFAGRFLGVDGWSGRGYYPVCLGVRLLRTAMWWGGGQSSTHY